MDCEAVGEERELALALSVLLPTLLWEEESEVEKEGAKGVGVDAAELLLLGVAEVQAEVLGVPVRSGEALRTAEDDPVPLLLGVAVERREEVRVRLGVSLPLPLLEGVRVPIGVMLTLLQAVTVPLATVEAVAALLAEAFALVVEMGVAEEERVTLEVSVGAPGLGEAVPEPWEERDDEGLGVPVPSKVALGGEEGEAALLLVAVMLPLPVPPPPVEAVAAPVALASRVALEDCEPPPALGVAVAQGKAESLTAAVGDASKGVPDVQAEAVALTAAVALAKELALTSPLAVMVTLLLGVPLACRLGVAAALALLHTLLLRVEVALGENVAAAVCVAVEVGWLLAVGRKDKLAAGVGEMEPEAQEVGSGEGVAPKPRDGVESAEKEGALVPEPAALGVGGSVEDTLVLRVLGGVGVSEAVEVSVALPTGVPDAAALALAAELPV